MKRLTLKSLFGIALCSIVAIAPCSVMASSAKKFKSVKQLSQGQNAPRWQQQLKWSADAYAVVYPELKLLGWREIGPLNNQEEIDQFIREGVDKDKLFGHTIFSKGDGKIQGYEIAPLTELAQKYDVWKGTTFENVKKVCNDRLSANAKVVELKWQYKEKQFIEKIAVSDQHNAQGGIIFSAIKLAVNSNKVPVAEWQIKDRERSIAKSEVDLSKYDKIDDDYWRIRLDRVKEKDIIKDLKLLEYKYIGVVETEEYKNKFFKKCISDDAYMLWCDKYAKPAYRVTTLGDVKRDNPNAYKYLTRCAKQSIRSLKLGYDKVVRLKWEYKGKKFYSYAFVSSYVHKLSGTGTVGKVDNKSKYLIFDNLLKIAIYDEALMKHNTDNTIAMEYTIKV